MHVQEQYQAGKSRTLVRAVRAAGDAAPRDLLTHVRLHVGRQTLVVERYLLGASDGAPVKALKGRIRVEVPLANVWHTCSATAANGASVAPGALQDCAWAAPAVPPAALVRERSGALRQANSADANTLHPGDGGEATGGAMLVALDTKILRIAPATGRGTSAGGLRLREDLMGVKRERWAAEVLDLPVTVAAPLPHRRSLSGALPNLVAFVAACSCHVCLLENASQ